MALARRSGGVSPRGRFLPPLLFFTDPERTLAPWEVAARLPTGSAVVYRAFSRRDATEVGHKIRAACDVSGALLLVGRDADLAARIDADGLHLPERDLQRAVEIRARHPDWIITCALHSGLGDRSAEGLDAFIVSPVFSAGGSSAAKPELGIEAFSALVQALPCPAYGLGGIHVGNVEMLTDTQACGIAGVDAIQDAFGG